MNKREELISQEEVVLVKGNPDMVGINIDQNYIIDTRASWSLARLKTYFKHKDGKINKSKFSSLALKKKKVQEEKKLVRLREYLEKFNGSLKYSRINPAGELSPVSPSQATELHKDRSFKVSINQRFIDQMKLIKKVCPNVILVVPFYNHIKGKAAADVPATSNEINQYLAICKTLICYFKTGIQIEIGNEVNVSKSTGPMFKDKLQYPSKVEIDKYVNFYIQIARTLKSASFELKLGIAGIACYDPNFLKTVLNDIKCYEAKNRASSLVNFINFHPYRKTPESGAAEIRNGIFIDNTMKYNQQVDNIIKIGQNYNLNLDIFVGEINFKSDHASNLEMLKESISSTSKMGLVSLIYP